MRIDLFQRAADFAEQGQPFAIAFVVRRLPASSSREGDMALITSDGSFHGWLGGSCTQPSVVAEAARALADGRPRLLSLSPDPEAERRPGVVVLPMTCQSGGSVEIYIEPILPAPRLTLFGDSPVAHALGRLGQAMGYVLTDADAKPVSTAPLYAVVAAMGNGDEEAVRRALALSPAYLGVVASRRRFAQIRETLLAQGVEPAALDRIKSPAGLNLGARTPHEIALSILAEIVELQRKAEPAAAPTPAPEAEAIDPICGMTVNIARAKHVTEHEGKSYYFCCGGCKAKFEAEPGNRS